MKYILWMLFLILVTESCGNQPKVEPITNLEQAILKQHNFFRDLGGLPTYSWNIHLAARSQKWATWLKKNKNCQMQHSTNEARKNRAGFTYIGENLYWFSSSAGAKITENQMKKAVEHWYAEIADFQYSKHGVACPKRNNKKQIGHFTQVMWQRSIELGCAAASCGNSLVVVCQYGPGGNISQTPPFSEAVAVRLDQHPYNQKYGGLPRCD